MIEIKTNQAEEKEASKEQRNVRIVSNLWLVSLCFAARSTKHAARSHWNRTNVQNKQTIDRKGPRRTLGTIGYHWIPLDTVMP